MKKAKCCTNYRLEDDHENWILTYPPKSPYGLKQNRMLSPQCNMNIFQAYNLFQHSDYMVFYDQQWLIMEYPANVTVSSDVIELFLIRFSSIFWRFLIFSSSVKIYSFLIPISKHFLSRQRLQNRLLDVSIWHRSSYGHLK